MQFKRISLFFTLVSRMSCGKLGVDTIYDTVIISGKEGAKRNVAMG